MANVQSGEFQSRRSAITVNRDGLKFGENNDSRPCTNPFRRAPL